MHTPARSCRPCPSRAAQEPANASGAAGTGAQGWSNRAESRRRASRLDGSPFARFAIRPTLRAPARRGPAGDSERNPPALIRCVRVDANGRLRVHRHIRGAAADPRAGARLQLSLIMSIAANAADRRRSEQVLNLAICQVAQATATPSRSRVHPSRRARCACVKLRRAAPVIARAIMALSGAGPGR